MSCTNIPSMCQHCGELKKFNFEFQKVRYIGSSFCPTSYTSIFHLLERETFVQVALKLNQHCNENNFILYLIHRIYNFEYFV